jgi:hypothetical protein
VCVALTGCTGGSSADPTAATTSAATTSTATTTAAAGGTGAPSVSATPGETVPPLPVLASRSTSDKDVDLQVDLNEVRVTGQVMQVTFTVRVTSPESRRWQVAQFFSDGQYQMKGGGTGAQDAFSVDGVYVLDPVNAKRYLPARVADGGCVCSGNLSATFVAPGSGGVILTSAFKAPPPEVTTVDVVVPKAGALAGVQVTR